MSRSAGTGRCDATRALVAGVLLASVLVAGACSKDEYTRVLEERARWNVEVASWVQVEGGVRLTLRIWSAPPSDLQTLTVRIVLADEAGQTLDEIWRPLDLSKAVRGTPSEIGLRVPTEHTNVAGVAIDVVKQPTPEQRARIGELPAVP